MIALEQRRGIAIILLTLCLEGVTDVKSGAYLWYPRGCKSSRLLENKGGEKRGEEEGEREFIHTKGERGRDLHSYAYEYIESKRTSS